MNYLVKLSYDGSNFHGWAKQPNNRTIQGEIEKILHQVLNENITIYASGRTDAYVHAIEQVFSFKTKYSEMKPRILLEALRALSPQDIYFKSVKTVNNAFHARFSAHSKIYKYEIDINKYDVFKQNYVLLYKHHVNLPLLKKVAKLLTGKHDFKSFSTSEVEDTVRTIMLINFKQTPHHLTITIKANGFLRNMVRMIVATLLDVNEHKKDLNQIKMLLDQPKKGSCISKVKGCGLYLYKVNY